MKPFILIMAWIATQTLPTNKEELINAIITILVTVLSYFAGRIDKNKKNNGNN